MSCPSCGSHKLWDDDMWWGCKTCRFMSNSIQNHLHPRDVFNEGTPHEWPRNKKREPVDEN